MKTKALLSLLLAVLLVLPLLCGCGETESTESDAPIGGVSVDESDTEQVGTEESAVSETVSRKIYKSVILIGIDGMGTFGRLSETPNIDRIFADGIATYQCLTATPTISAQCWGSMLTGVTPTMHGHNNDGVASVATNPDAKYPSVFKTISEQIEDASLAAFCHWNHIYNGIIEHNIGVVNKTGNDKEIKNQTVEYLKSNLPTFMFLQLDEADAAGHSSGYGSNSHFNKIKELDQYVGEIYDALKESGNIDDVLFIVTSDHGGWEKGHGGQTDEERYVFFGATGQTVMKNDKADLRVVDIPAIIAYALGIEKGDGWISRLPDGIFADNPRGEAKKVFAVPDAGFESTPLKSDDGYIGNFLDTDKITALLTFDKSVKSNYITTEAKGTQQFSTGIHGQSLILTGSNYVSLPDVKFGTESFSIACWVNLPYTPSDPVIYSNKDWASGRLNGFVLSSRTNDFKFNVGDGGNRVDIEYAYPEAHESNWYHTLLVVNRQEERVYMYVNFELIGDIPLSNELKGDSFDSSLPFNIGADGKGNYNLKGKIDDFIIYDDALTQAEVERFGEYYK